jgi:hypothetical protein
MEDIESAPSRRSPFRIGSWGGQAFVKRTVDLAVSATALAILSPVMLLAAIAVVIDDGFPVFFGHRRQGRDGRIFRCWKFRTMRRNAEALARELRTLNVCDGPQFFIQDDPRVTRVGRRLRAWNIDELPQLWNVLVGDGTGGDEFWTSSRITVDVRCVYSGVGGQQLWTAACTADPTSDSCQQQSADWYVVNANGRLRTMTVSPDVQYGVGALGASPCALRRVAYSSGHASG